MSEAPLRTIVTETQLLIVTRHEFASGTVVTIYREKASPPAVTFPARVAADMGALEVARREFDAATDRDAEDLVTAWDRSWGVH